MGSRALASPGWASMTHWQVRADLGPGLFLFGIEAGNDEAARDKAAGLLEGIPDFRVALLEIREIPGPEDR